MLGAVTPVGCFGGHSHATATMMSELTMFPGPRKKSNGGPTSQHRNNDQLSDRQGPGHSRARRYRASIQSEQERAAVEE